MENIKSCINKYIDYGILSAILFFHAIPNIWWILKDTKPPGWDQSVHLMLGLAYFRGYNPVTTSNYYPPGLHLSLSPLFAFFNESFDTACFVNIFFLGILLLSIYEIGKTLFNREVGLYSALIISFIPMLIIMQRDFLLDFGLVSIMALSLCLLLKTDNFHNLNYSLAFGAVVGFALLIKWTAIIFIFIPLLWVIWQNSKEEKECAYCNKHIKNKKKRITTNFYHFCSEKHKQAFKEEGKFPLATEHNLILSLLFFVFSAGWWYIPNFNDVADNLLFGQRYAGLVEGDPTGLLGFWYYIEAISIQACLFISLLILVGIVFFFTKVEKNKKILVGTSILFPFLIFSTIANKDVRYTVPLLIFFVLTVGFMLSSLKRKQVKILVISAILIVGIVQTSTVTFGYPSFSTPNYVYPVSNPPKEEDWQAEEILSNFHESSRVLILYNEYHMNWRTLQYYAFLNRANVYIDGYEVISRGGRKVTDYDFVLCVKENMSVTSEQKKQIADANKLFQSQSSGFEEIEKIIMPNKKELSIYRKGGKNE